jgi:hypothetical protein
MSKSDPDLSTPLRTIVIAMSVPEAVLSRFRAEFPEIRFIVPSGDPADDGDSDSVRETPTEDDLSVADGLIGWELPADQLAAATRLRWMHAGGAGVERYELAQIAARGDADKLERRVRPEHGRTRAGHDDRADPPLPTIAAGADPEGMARRGNTS